MVIDSIRLRARWRSWKESIPAGCFFPRARDSDCCIGKKQKPHHSLVASAGFGLSHPGNVKGGSPIGIVQVVTIIGSDLFYAPHGNRSGVGLTVYLFIRESPFACRAKGFLVFSATYTNQEWFIQYPPEGIEIIMDCNINRNVFQD